MSGNDLSGSLHRVMRANKHLADLRREIASLYTKQADSVIVEFDPSPPHQLRVRPPTNPVLPDLIIGIVIGEICYNLRSSLDYLIFSLAKHDSGEAQAFTQFPIVDKEKDFWGSYTQKRLVGINPAHVATIEQLQPYKGCSWTKTLRDLSNTDKHREFNLIGGELRWVVHSKQSAPNHDSIQYPIRRTPHPAGGEVEVTIEFSSEISFADGTPVEKTLAEIIIKVAETLAAFAPEFK